MLLCSKEGEKGKRALFRLTVNIQPHQRVIIILFQTNRSGLIFVIGNQSSLTTEQSYQTPQPLHIAGKWSTLIPLTQKRGYLMLACCIVSSRSSLDHSSHICKSCRMNGVCVKSLASKQSGWWPRHVLDSPHMLHSVVFPHDSEHEDTFSACSHMWFHFCCDGLRFVFFVFSPSPCCLFYGGWVWWAKRNKLKEAIWSHCQLVSCILLLREKLKQFVFVVIEQRL